MSFPFQYWLTHHLQAYDVSNRDLSAATGVNDSIIGRYANGQAHPGYETLTRFKLWLEDLYEEQAGPGFDANIWFNEWLARKFIEASVKALEKAPDPRIADKMKIDESAMPSLERNFGAWLCTFLLLTGMSNVEFAKAIQINHTAIGFYLRTDEEKRHPTLPTLIKIHKYLEDQAELLGWPLPDANVFWETDTAAHWLKSLTTATNQKVSLKDISRPIDRFVKEGKCRA